jgi:hypothetical protein
MSAAVERIRLETAIHYPQVRERHKGRMVRIWSGEHAAYWRPDCGGYTREVSEAGVYSFEDAYAATNHCGREKEISFEPLLKRHARREVRNPILGLPAAARVKACPPEARALLAEILLDLSKEARAKAEYCWKTRKPPMAGYYAATAVVAKHIARVVRP